MYGVINWRIGVVVQFYDVLRKFWEVKGTGTAFLEANLLQNLVELREKFLYEVLLGLRKAYDALNRESCMKIIGGYGSIPQMERILWNYWDHLSMVDRAGRYYGTPFKGCQGVTQGGPIYTTIFNMVVDAVI